MVVSRYAVAAVLLELAAQTVAHGDDEQCHGNMCDMKKPDSHEGAGASNNQATPSYASLGMHGKMMLAHIALMVLAWFFILPIGKSVSHSQERERLTRDRRHVQRCTVQICFSLSIPFPRRQWLGGVVWDDVQYQHSGPV